MLTTKGLFWAWKKTGCIKATWSDKNKKTYKGSPKGLPPSLTFPVKRRKTFTVNMHLTHKQIHSVLLQRTRQKQKRLQDKCLSKNYKVFLTPLTSLHNALPPSLPLSSCTELYVHFTQNVSCNSTASPWTWRRQWPETASPGLSAEKDTDWLWFSRQRSTAHGQPTCKHRNLFLSQVRWEC